MGRQYLQELTLHASAPETADDNSADFAFTPDSAIFTLDITAKAGTSPTLDVTIEEKDPVSGKYTVIDTFPQEVAEATIRRALAGPIGGTIRAKWVITGSAGQSFTFTLAAEGKQVQ